MSPVITGLSGNEIFCLQRKGLTPADIVIGNSVYSMGVLGNIGSGIRTYVGGEVKSVTDLIKQGRELSYQRLVADAQKQGAHGVTGVSSDVIMHANNAEFLSIGSGVTMAEGGRGQLAFTASGDAQELFCLVDAGYRPIKFVFGNVCYALGLGGGIMASFRALARGEVVEYSNMFNHTRRLALERMLAEARQEGANAVLGIRTSIVPFQMVQEMIMIGTACYHEGLPGDSAGTPYSSDLTAPELWNLASLGLAPIRLVLGCSVYSLGVLGNLMSGLKSLARGEISELTTLIYEAREKALEHIQRDAAACGADDVAGIKVYVYELPNNMIEMLAIGTAIKRVPNHGCTSEALPIQAVMDDKRTFVNAAQREASSSASLNRPGGVRSQSDSKKTVKGGLDIIALLLRLLAG